MVMVDQFVCDVDGWFWYGVDDWVIVWVVLELLLVNLYWMQMADPLDQLDEECVGVDVFETITASRFFHH